MVEIRPTFIQQVLLLILLELFFSIKLQQKLSYLFSSLLVVLEQIGLIEIGRRENLQSCHVCTIGELSEVKRGDDIMEYSSEMPVLFLWEISMFLNEFGQPAEQFEYCWQVVKRR